MNGCNACASGCVKKLSGVLCAQQKQHVADKVNNQEGYANI